MLEPKIAVERFLDQLQGLADHEREQYVARILISHDPEDARLRWNNRQVCNLFTDLGVPTWLEQLTVRPWSRRQA